MLAKSAQTTALAASLHKSALSALSSATMLGMQLPVSAGCICGAVQLRSDAPPVGVVNCHCLACQKISGSDYQHNAYFKPDELKVIRGEDCVVGIDIPGFPVRRCYCRKCNARVFHERLDADKKTPIRKTVPVGVVTSKAGSRDPAWAATDHIFYGERARDQLDELPKWKGLKGESARWQPPDGPAEAAVPLNANALPPLPAPPITATCHCGQTRVEAEAAPSAVYYCHCRDCQALTGADYAHNSAFSPMQLRVTAGQAQLRSFSKDGSPRVTFSCGRCMDRMYRQAHDADGKPTRQVLPVGVVDKLGGPADPAWQPRFHMYYSERAVDVPDGLPKWAGVPNASELLDAGSAGTARE